MAKIPFFSAFYHSNGTQQHYIYISLIFKVFKLLLRSTMGDRKSNFVFALGDLGCLCNACGTNRGWRPFCFFVAKNLHRFDARCIFKMHFHVSPTQIGMSTALFNL